MTVLYKLKNAAAIGTVPTAIYTVPASTVALVTSLIIANRSGSDITVSLQITDSSTATTSYILPPGTPIPIGGAIIPLGDNNKQAMETTDILTLTSSAGASADATLSVMEETP